ncbi:winged helix-turn-helix transcriptional regulator [Onishia taeanensis]|jgi:DNA-binding HxlR family transcriptional regulator|uniref:winged helix-turn-helix transcriptional regulator n=2 Tax=Halomonadaceae TaxID=28256 RepID=UPI003CC915EB|tara:strand:+ start:2788 stop:3156 length:369 start_codon:yes stop_codon:yes gene_type:complete
MDHKNMRHQSYACSFGCSVEAAIEAIGGKWKGVILFHLTDGTKRFNELRRLMPSVTQRMLTKQLRELERDGIVHRHVYAEVPPRVEYRLTAFGETLEPILKELEAWGSQYLDKLSALRSADE